MNESVSPPTIGFYRGLDGQPLAVRRWEQDEAAADVVFLHGIISHGGWYESSCSHLASQGFRVHFLERRGSGLNADHRGDIEKWNTWLSDVTVYLEQLVGPRIVLGISWGGILAMALAHQHAQLMSGVGLVCPGLFSTKAASPVQRLGLRIASSVGLKRMRVAVPLQDPSLFTNSKIHQTFVGQDPLALREITIRMASRNVELLEYALSAPEEIRVPILLMLAADDPIAVNDRTRQWVNRIGHEDKTTIEYANASHTLEFEEDPSQYFDDLTAWCRRMAQQTD